MRRLRSPKNESGSSSAKSHYSIDAGCRLNALSPLQATAPWLRRWVAQDADAHRALWRVRGATAGTNLFIGSLRGWKMQKRDGVFEQFAALLQFPRYFGGNWSAFIDCVG